MEAIILKLLQPDNAVIEAGTRELKAALSSPQALPELCSVLTTTTASPEVRQYAAVLLRKKFGQERLWLGLSGEQRDLVRQGCLGALQAESQPSVRQAIVQLVGVLARREPWPELRAFIVASWSSDQSEARVWGVRTWSVVCQEAGAQVRPELPQFAPLLQRAWSQGEPEMAYYATQALQALVPHLGSEELPLVQPLITHVVAALPALVRADQDRAARALELFDALFECEVPIVAPHLPLIVELCLNLAAQSDLEDSLRVSAITLLGRLGRLKKKAIIKHKLYGPMINTLFPIMCYVPPDQEEEAVDLIECAHPSTCACQAMDCLAIQLPPEKFMPPLLRLVEPALQDGRPEMMKGAFNALAVIAEGCSEHIRTKYMVSFLQAIGQGIKHTHPSVKSAALYALGQFSEYLQPEINNYASDILPVLFEFLDEASQQMKQTRRDPPGLNRIFYALEIFCENLEKKLEPFLSDLMSRLLALLQGDEISVRTQELTISAIGAAANATGQAIYPFFDPIMVNLKRYLNLTSSSEQELTLLTQSMDTLGTLARAVGPTGFVPSLAEECCKLSLDLVTKYDDPDVRKCAFAMFGSVSFVVKDQGIGEVLPSIIDMMIRSVESKEGISFEYKDEGDSHLPLEDLSDDEDEDGEISLNSSSNASNLKAVNVENAFEEAVDLIECAHPSTCACQAMDCLAIQLPPEKFMPPLLRLVEPALQDGRPEMMKGAFNALAVIAEGCSEHIRTKYMVSFLQAIGQGIKHTHPSVKSAALYALGQFSEYLQPEINNYASDILPVLFEFLDEASQQMKQTRRDPPGLNRIFYALEIFCENLEKKLEPFLSDLMSRLLALLQGDEISVRTQELTISAIGAAANATGQAIYPFFDPIMVNLKRYLNLTSSSEQELTLLTQSMDTLGTLARAVGPTGFVPSLAEECCKLSLDLVTKYDDPDVRKCAFAMFGSVSFVVKDQGIGEVLPSIIDMMIRSVESKEGISFEYKDEGDSHLPLEDLSDDEDEDGEISLNSSSNASNLKAVNVENAFMEEKEQAVIALKEICLNSPHSFYPYLQKSSEVIWGVLEFPDEDVRKSAAEALAEFARCYFKMGTPQGQEAFQNAITALVPKLCSLVQSDPEAGVVSMCLDQLAYLLKECLSGVAGIPGYPEMITQCVRLVMKSECACMATESCCDRDCKCEPEDENIQSEQDEVLFEYAGEVLPALGNAMNPTAFSPYFAGMLPHLLKKTKKSCTVSERSFGAGSLADCMKPLQGALDPYIKTLFPIFLTLLNDDEDDVRNNAIFGLGELAFRSGPAMYDKYSTILQTLSNILAVEENVRVVDQILGAVCRLLVTNIDLVPLDEVLPVIFKNLPLKEDVEENTIIMKAILVLYAQGHPQVRQNVPKIMEVAVTAFKTGEEAMAEDNDLAKTLLTNLSRDMPDEFASTLTAIPDNVASKISQIVQAQ
ncbi:importin-4-like [Tigriopus californicus]|uniref:importin-4-like n=1 Tax=Tigriopus californicus TaxID=6832 RepID=UPI0027DA88F3|nr:importin-4-like [Tigriopus californicus]